MINVIRYTRTKPNGEMEIYIGLKDKRMIVNPDYTCLNPIIDGTVWRGICHTNAVIVKEGIEYHDTVKDSATHVTLN